VISTFTVTVNAINDAPELTPANPTMTGITEDDTTNSGMLISAIVDSSIIDDIDSNADSGIAIYSYSGNGKWQYSLDGTNWNNVDEVSGTSALLLAADADNRIRYIPDGKNGEAASFSYYAWDQTSGDADGTTVDVSSRGGTTAFSDSGDVSSIEVTDVNDAPVLDNSDDMTLTVINEDDTTNTTNLGTLVSDVISSAGGDRITDVDEGAVEGITVISADTAIGKWQNSTDGEDNWKEFLEISDNSAMVLTSTSNDMIRFLPKKDSSGTASITFRAWNTTSGEVSGTVGVDASVNGDTTAFSSATETAQITVYPVNDPPHVRNPIDDLIMYEDLTERLTIDDDYVQIDDVFEDIDSDSSLIEYDFEKIETSMILLI